MHFEPDASRLSNFGVSGQQLLECNGLSKLFMCQRHLVSTYEYNLQWCVCTADGRHLSRRGSYMDRWWPDMLGERASTECPKLASRSKPGSRQYGSRLQIVFARRNLDGHTPQFRHVHGAPAATTANYRPLDAGRGQKLPELPYRHRRRVFAARLYPVVSVISANCQFLPGQPALCNRARGQGQGRRSGCFWNHAHACQSTGVRR